MLEEGKFFWKAVKKKEGAGIGLACPVRPVCWGKQMIGERRFPPKEHASWYVEGNATHFWPHFHHWWTNECRHWTSVVPLTKRKKIRHYVFPDGSKTAPPMRSSCQQNQPWICEASRADHKFAGNAEDWGACKTFRQQSWMWGKCLKEAKRGMDGDPQTQRNLEVMPRNLSFGSLFDVF